MDYSISQKIVKNNMVNVDKLCPHAGCDNDIYDTPPCKAPIVNKELLYSYVPDCGVFRGPKTTKAKSIVYGGDSEPLYTYTCENGHKFVRWSGWCDVPEVEPGTNDLHMSGETLVNEGKMFGRLENFDRPRSIPGYVSVVKKIKEEGYTPSQDEMDQYGVTPDGKGHGNPGATGYELKKWGLK
jgi:hypothetical protein